MAATTSIQWTDHTFNPWWGCSRVSAACRSCYADGTAKRWGHELWRRKGPRLMLSDANWRNPLKWNRAAEAAGQPAKVFAASMADVFEIHAVDQVNAQLDAARARLWSLIERTPWLVWQLLTKRPENVAALAPWTDTWPDNVWLGASVEDNRRAAERIPILLSTHAATKFLSCEPLLEDVDLGPWLSCGHDSMSGTDQDGLWRCDHCSAVIRAEPDPRGPIENLATGATFRHTQISPGSTIDWVICGGESGPKARPMGEGWARSIVDQCQTASVPVFVKQMGAVWAKDTGTLACSSKGGDPDVWPADLRVRQFPGVSCP